MAVALTSQLPKPRIPEKKLRWGFVMVAVTCAIAAAQVDTGRHDDVVDPVREAVRGGIRLGLPIAAAASLLFAKS